MERIEPVTAAQCRFTVSGQPHPCAADVEEELLQIARVSDNGQGFALEEGYSKPGQLGAENHAAAGGVDSWQMHGRGTRVEVEVRLGS